MGVLLPVLPKPIRWGGVIAIAEFIFYVSVITTPPEVVVVDDGGTGDTTSIAVNTNGGSDRTNIFSLIEGIFDGPIGFTWDQWQHFAAYGALAYSLAYAIVDWEFRDRVAVVFVILVLTAFGVGIELLQLIVPAHSFNFEDVLANTIGACSVLIWFCVDAVFRTPTTGRHSRLEVDRIRRARSALPHFDPRTVVLTSWPTFQNCWRETTPKTSITRVRHPVTIIYWADNVLSKVLRK